MGDNLAYNEALNNDAISWHNSDIPDDIYIQEWCISNVNLKT